MNINAQMLKKWGPLLFTSLAILPFFSLAWMNDDAFITFRTVDNFVRGFGLTWNPIERVQAYTHPLWMLLLLPLSLFHRDIFLNGMVLSLALNFALFWILLKRSTTGAFLVVLLYGAKCFQDYGISGLENPLLHLLLGLFVIATGRERLVEAVFIGALGYLTRQDSVLITAPCLAYLGYLEARRAGFKRVIVAFSLGLSPVFIWSIFSFLYYGFIFPNTAYAKLATGIDSAPLIDAGLKYYKNSFNWDPLALTMIALTGVIVALRGKPCERIIFGGLVLYLIYVIQVGGDYMSGRFISAPFVLAVFLIAPYIRKTAGIGLAVIAVIAALFNPRSFFSVLPLPEKIFDRARVADSRRSFANETSLVAYLKNDSSNRHRFNLKGIWMRREPRTVFTSKAIGMEGFAAGPKKTIIDIYGLSDPLLARLPVKDPTRWRVGHYARNIPTGYEKAILEGPDLIADKDLAEFYRALFVITRSPILSAERLTILLRFHLGQFEKHRLAYLNRVNAQPSHYVAPDASSPEALSQAEELSTQ